MISLNDQLRLQHNMKIMYVFIRIKLVLLFQFVVMTFWILYAVDRELVYPKHLDNIIPSWLNHMLVSLHLRNSCLEIIVIGNYC